MNRRSSKEDIQTANKDMKRCSTALVIQERQNHNEIPHFTSMAIIFFFKGKIMYVGEDMEKLEP